MTPKLSLVTGTLDRPASLDRLLRSIHANTTGVDYEVIIGDASERSIVDKTNRLPASVNLFESGRIRVLNEHPRLGHIKGYNRLFKQFCTGEFVIWLNDDCEVNPGYDTAAISFMEANPSLGLGALYYAEYPAYQYHVNMCFSMIFANFGILKREWGDKIGWFDEGFQMYGGDNSITYNTLLNGKGVGTVPHKSIIHHSEKDDLRNANELAWRKMDGQRMNEIYAPLRRQMRDPYVLSSHLIGPRILP